MTYNLSNLASSNNFLDYSIAVNDLSGGFLFAIFIIIIGMVVFSRIEGKDTQKFAAATFACFVLSLVLVSVGVLSATYAIFSFIALLLAVFGNLVAD